MPCFNHGSYVEASMRSILAQTYSDLELIVIDDGSSDHAPEVVTRLAQQDPRVRFIRNERNLGASASRNRGIRSSRGEFVAFCDADDLWHPGKLACQLERLNAEADYGVIYNESEIIDSQGNLTGQSFSDLHTRPRKRSGRIYEELCIDNFINMQTALVRRHLLERVLFDERIKWCEDWWFWLQLSLRTKFLFLEEPLAQYRIHALSTNVKQASGMARNRVKVYLRNLQQNPNMHPQVKGRTYYLLGCGLKAIRRPRQALAYMVKGFQTTLRSEGLSLNALRMGMNISLSAIKAHRVAV